MHLTDPRDELKPPHALSAIAHMFAVCLRNSLTAFLAAVQVSS